MAQLKLPVVAVDPRGIIDYPCLRRRGPIETWLRVISIRLRKSSYPFLLRSGPIETSDKAFHNRTLRDPIHVWEDVAQLKHGTGNNRVNSLRITIHVWEDVAQLKPLEVPASQTIVDRLSMSEETWPNCPALDPPWQDYAENWIISVQWEHLGRKSIIEWLPIKGRSGSRRSFGLETAQ